MHAVVDNTTATDSARQLSELMLAIIVMSGGSSSSKTAKQKLRDGDGAGAAQKSQDECLDEHERDDPRSARAERIHQRKLSLSRRGSHQQQISDIHACDEQGRNATAASIV